MDAAFLAGRKVIVFGGTGALGGAVVDRPSLWEPR
jgi:FlaA1/EpsC-like NDP-sugar epimerase